jgi:putative toxin-antitoxin system antitoxin component (TIGR02293 family)
MTIGQLWRSLAEKIGMQSNGFLQMEYSGNFRLIFWRILNIKFELAGQMSYICGHISVAMKGKEKEAHKEQSRLKVQPIRVDHPVIMDPSDEEEFMVEDFSMDAISYKLNSYLEPFLKQVISKIDYQIPFKDLTLANLLSDRMLMVMAIKEGIPYRVFRLIRQISPFSPGDWARLLNLSTKSMKRYEQSGSSFRPIYSEKIMEMAEVTNVGLDVFDTMDQFKLWLDTPNFSLGRQKPIDLLSDSYGKELVINELVRTDQGIFA